ncbi:MAG: DegV family protein [Butyricicoccus sp.]|nr:DegV family protein [Butyricicoccus sp.]
MSKIAIVTDTNSSMTQEEADSLGVYLLPMPFIVNEVDYFEGVSCSYEHFFEMLANGDDVSSSQPSPQSIISLWEEALKQHDYVVHIPMSSALSGSCGTAKALAESYNGRVLVADNKRISISQRQAVFDALYMIEQGMTAQEIHARLEKEAYNASIYLAVNTLELLKKSGRVTAAGAALATVLGLKPVLQIQGEKLDAFAKVRGMAHAGQTMLEAAKKDLETRFAGKNVSIATAYSGDLAPAQEWLEQVRSYFLDDSIQLCRLPISICCHVGAGVKAVAVIEVIK